MDYREVLQYQDELAQKHKYKPLPLLYREEALSVYTDNLPEGFVVDGSDVPLFSPDGLQLCTRYNRIVVGDYGAFVEILPEDMVHENITVQEGQEYRDYDQRYSKHTKYSWLTSQDESGIKIYFQKKPVAYADYVPGRYYISPYECRFSGVLEKEGSFMVERSKIEKWLNKQGVSSPDLLSHYEKLSSIHGQSLNVAIEQDLFPGDFEYWVRLNEVCGVDGGLSYEQFSAVRYNLDLLGMAAHDIKGTMATLGEAPRTAIRLGLELFPLPFESEHLSPHELYMLLSMPADKLVEVCHLSKVLAGCKAESLITDVDAVVRSATQRATYPNIAQEAQEMTLT